MSAETTKSTGAVSSRDSTRAHGSAPSDRIAHLERQLSQERENITLCARYALGIRVEDGHEYFEGVRQTTYDVLALARRHKQAMTLLRGIVAQYEAAPDGPLGAGFTNEPFLAAKEFLQNH